MSYIIAHVAFDDSGRTYPVNCNRTDIAIGRKVVVKMHDRKLKWARIEDLNHLNWECQNTIECLASEATFSPDGIILPSGGSLSVKGLARPYDLAVHLYQSGWTPRRAANKTYRKSYTATNQSQTALIMMRKNGIDVQIIEGLPTEKVAENSVLSTRRADGPFTAQPYKGSLHNIFERIASFSEAFLNNVPNLGDMVTPIQTTKTLPSPPAQNRRSSNDLYLSLDGSGEPIYLSDGVWLSAGGRTHDWGR